MSRPNRKRTRPNPNARSIISKRDLDVLASIVWAGVLTTGQVERLHFPSRRRAQRRLRALVDHGLARASLQAGALERENVYTVSPRGLDRLVEAGHFDGAAPPKLGRLPRVSKLAHALAVRDVFVAAVLWERDGESRRIDVAFEGELARDEDFRRAGIVPDALVELAVGARSTDVFVEVDLGTETTTTLRKKLERWRAFRRSGTRAFDLLVLTVREGRLRTFERLVGEVRLDADLDLLASVAASLARRAPQPLAAAPRRAERPAVGANAGGFRPVG